MKLRRSLRRLEEEVADLTRPSGTRIVLRNIGWVSAGVGVLTVGLVLGRELRQRYKFTRRTPYDFYAHSGDRASDVEFGVGI